MNNPVTRKDFLLKTSKAAVGLTAVASVSSLVTTATTKANTKVTPWPWPYTALDKEAVRKQGHYLFYNDKDCCAGTFGAISTALATAIGDPWTNIPMEIMLYGRGGGNAWGTLCGCLNGAAALISLVTTKAQSGPLISELWGWYTQAELPTDESNAIAVSGQFLVHNYDQELPQNVSGSPLCHASVTEW
ncbi:MAG: C_GCAxxG_C_C family protein, partial [Ignavibacteriaceae bacterium]|nr:C_GCAxxG_C_C family protein [Ignavibacteriaceae bacterium]